MEGPKILSLDGGNGRSMITLQFLFEIEKRISPKKIHEYFDLVVGTNTGALIVACLCYLQYSVRDVEQVLFNYVEICSPKKASHSLSPVSNVSLGLTLGDTDGLERFITNLFKDIRLDSIQNPKILITCAEQRAKSVGDFFFRNYELEDDIYAGTMDATVASAILASTATPVLFRSYQFGSKTLVDGSVRAINPSMIGLLQAQRIWPDDNPALLVALGSGVERSDAIRDDRLRSIITSEKMNNAAFEITHPNIPHSDIIANMKIPRSNVSNLMYIRLQVELTAKEMDLQDLTTDQLPGLKAKAEEYLRKRSDIFVPMLEAYQWN